MTSKQLRRLTAAFVSFGPACFTGCDKAAPPQNPAEQTVEAIVDSLLPAIERLSGLHATNPVRVEMIAPPDVDAYVLRRMEEELPPVELDGIRAAYMMLGLLPDTLDLRALLLELYAEQIAGFYDPDRKTLYAVEGVPPAALNPVLAHELVHALQDQHVNLDSLIARRRGNDRQSAAQAAIEGHATLAMFAWVAEVTSGEVVDPATLPDPSIQLETAFRSRDTEFPVFGRAPRIIRETLVFPYAVGAGFVQALWQRPGAGREPPFGPFLPQSTEQVMRPVQHFIVQRDLPTELRYDQPTAGWTTVYENTLGALETGIFIDEHTGTIQAGWEGWDGDRYRLMATANDDRLMVWTSIWDNEASADRFAGQVREILGNGRFGRPGRVDRADLEGRPIVRVLIAGSQASIESSPLMVAYCADENGARTGCAPG